MESEREKTVSEIKKADTNNPEAVEVAANRALSNTEITLPHTNEVPQVINEATTASDDEDDEDFNINVANNTKTKVDAEEAV